VSGDGGGRVGSEGIERDSSIMLASVMSGMSGKYEIGVNVGEAEPNGSETSCSESPGVAKEAEDADEVDVVDVEAEIGCGV